MSDKTKEITMTETIPIEKIEIICKKLNKQTTIEAEYNSDLSNLKKKSPGGENKVKYNYKIKVKNGTCYGRMYPFRKGYNGTVPCYLTLQSNLRDFLLKDTFYTQIDLSNCHQVILASLFKKFNINCPELEEYNKNRKQIVLDNNLDKGHIGRCINDLNFWEEDNKQYGDLFKKINKAVYERLYPILKESMLFSDLHFHLKEKLEKDKKIENSFISLCLQTLENRYILTAYEYFGASGFSCESMIFDALIVKNFNSEKLTEHNNNIYEKFKEKHELDLKIEFKEHIPEISDQIQMILNRLDRFEDPEKEEEEKTVINTEKEIAKWILDKNKEYFFKYRSEIWVYHPKNKVWFREGEDDKKFIETFDMYAHECNLKTGSETNPIIVSDKSSCWDGIRRQFKVFCNKLDNDNARGNLLDNKKGVVPFTNGFYDLINDNFVEYGENDNNHLNFFTTTCERPFNKNIDEKKLLEVKEIMLKIYNGSEEEMDEEFSFYARALGGHVEDKQFLVCCGLRNSGKSVKTDSFLDAFNGLCGSLQLEELEISKNGMYVETDRKLGFLSNFFKNRIVFGNEIRNDIKLDGTLLKKIVSGGDEVSARAAFGKKQTGKIRGSLVISAQTIPNVEPKDALNNMLYCDMPVSFYSKEEYEEKILNPGMTVPMVGDDNLKNAIKTPEYLDSFTHLVFSYYKTEKPTYTNLKMTAMETRQEQVAVFDTVEYLDNVFEKYFIISKDGKIKTSDFHRVFLNTDFKAETTAQKVGFYFIKKLKLQKTTIKGYTYYHGITRLDDFVED